MADTTAADTLAKEWERTFNHDIERMVNELYAPDALLGGVVMGPEKFLRFERRVLDAAPNRAMRIERTHALDDGVVVEAARRHGVDVHAVSINYHASDPEHGLMLGFCALDDKTMRRAVGLLRKSFEELEASVARPARHVRP